MFRENEAQQNMRKRHEILLKRFFLDTPNKRGYNLKRYEFFWIF